MRGLNLADPLTGMKDGYALRLDNWVCRSDGLHVRQGCEVVTEEHGGPITALMGYPGHVFAATATEVFDGQASVLSGLGGGAWQSALLANPGGLHLVAVNGVDTPRRYDGLAWHTAVVTGTDATKWHTVVEHHRRIFAAEKNSLRLWYLGLNAIGGPATPIHLEAQCKKGGQIAAVASLQPSGGRGADSQLVIVTTEGELIVYAGANPDVAATWTLSGVWNVPKPRGRRAFAQVGGALALLTDKGLLPIPAILSEKDSGKPTKSMSAGIDPALHADTVGVVESASAELVVLYGADHQWTLTPYGWSRFTLPSARVWAEVNGALYFGTTTGEVCRYGGDLDGPAPIRSFAVDAFSQFGTPNTKVFNRVRALYRAAHPYVPRIELLTNYRDPPADFDAANIDDRYWQWSDVTWPRQPMPWVRETSSELQNWRGISGHGHSAAIMMSMQSRTPVIWTGYETTFQAGGRQ